MDNDSKWSYYLDCCISVIMYTIVVEVMFKQPQYYGTEKNKPKSHREVKPVLVFSNPSSTVITMKVQDTDGTATGMCIYVYVCM